MTKEYAVEVPGLTEKIASAKPSNDHKELLKTIRGFGELSSAKLATWRDGMFLQRRKVLNADRALIHKNHEKFLEEQLAMDGGNAAVTFDRLKTAGYLLTKCEITTLYFVHDRGGSNQANFFQLQVNIEDEFVDCKLFGSYSFAKPGNLRDLMDDCKGDEFDGDNRVRFSPTAYVFEKLVDVAAFVKLAEAAEAVRREAMKQMTFTVQDPWTNETEEMTQDQLAPGWNKFPDKTRRLFDDWAMSSAGRSGHRICDSWVMSFSDWTDPQGERWLGLVPEWNFLKPLAKVESNKGDAYTFFGKLQTLDRRVKVPFAWYFYMLHGNRVRDGAGERVLREAEAGLIVLAEHDYRVLKSWSEMPYGF